MHLSTTVKTTNRVEAIENVCKWLLHSGIQNMVGDPSVRGAFNAWYDTELDSYPYMYTEITGYGMSALTSIIHLYNDPGGFFGIKRRLSYAHQWIRGVAIHGKTGGMRTRKYYIDSSIYNPHYSFDSGILYTFDSGMVINGLVAGYDVIQANKHVVLIDKVAKFILGSLKGDGSIYPIYNTNSGKWEESYEKWSTQSGAYHAKLAIGLYAYGVHSGKQEYISAANSLCDFALSLQLNSGAFPSYKGGERTHLHPHTYAMEGLVYVGLRDENKEYLESAVRGIEWSLSQQNSDGSMPREVNGAEVNEFERVDVLAQTLRMAVLLRAYGLLDVSSEVLDKLENRLISYQRVRGTHKGGFVYGCNRDGKVLPNVNSWVSMFAMQALLWREQVYKGEEPCVKYII